jgi:uncharacterized Zn finger protein
MIKVVVPNPVLSDTFDRETVRRGREYAAAGQVLSYQPFQDGDTVVLMGEVAGTRSTPYQVRVVIQRDGEGVDIYSACTCPVGMDCSTRHRCS